MIDEQSNNLTYQVVCDGVIVKDKVISMSLAEHYILELSESDQKKSVIVPITTGGQQVLFS